MTRLVVTGTGTGVGKTVVTAAVAALARQRGTCTVVKPAQTGIADGEPGDLDDVRRLAGDVGTCELVRYPDPLAPAAAARLSGRPPLDPAAFYNAVLRLDDDLVLVEGAGGLLVRFDEDGTTLADLARGLRAPVLVVAEAGLGTLNATALTLEALAHRGLELLGVVVGSWPAEAGLAERSNLRDLEMLAARPLLGVLPEQAGALDASAFLEVARAGLAPQLGGAFDPREHRRRWDP
ncbi:MAG TPA: dethiobiotin synthase [Mycobacteriales bacterium]|nr:dethiobiotin synthase [Mycobacteriales bacterium]